MNNINLGGNARVVLRVRGVEVTLAGSAFNFDFEPKQLLTEGLPSELFSGRFKSDEYLSNQFLDACAQASPIEFELIVDEAGKFKKSILLTRSFFDGNGLTLEGVVQS